MSALHAIPAFAGTLWHSRTSLSRDAFEAWQSRRLHRWLRRDLPRVAFYSNAPPRLADLPVIDKATVMARFEDFNRGQITANQGWAAFENGGRIGDIFIGASTGTSGNRALYAITGAERYRWLGAMLARTVPRFLWQRERVAVILPQGSALYDGANRSRALTLRFYDLRDGAEAWTDDLRGFAPTTIVAPPRMLRHLADTTPGLAPRRLYAGAETLDPVDRAVIEARFGLRLGQIYMATEGLFATSCAHGGLHLAEDLNHFELEPVEDGLVSPIVTGFCRRFQIMARYRMNDLLRLSSSPCPCGSPLRTVAEVVGRMDDLFRLPAQTGPRVVTPDVMRNAVLDAARAITDFRIWQTAPNTVQLVLHPRLATADADAARDALAALFARRGLSPEVTLVRDRLDLDTGRKLRRVEYRVTQ